MRRNRFLAEIDKVTPWGNLHILIEPLYRKVEGAGPPPIEIEALGDAGCHGLEKRPENVGKALPGKKVAHGGKAGTCENQHAGEVELSFHVINNLFRHRKTR